MDAHRESRVEETRFEDDGQDRECGRLSHQAVNVLPVNPTEGVVD